MYYYFQAQFKDTDDIYVVRVQTTVIDSNSEQAAKGIAREIIEKTILNTEDNFEIKELTLQDLVSQLHFVEDIAQFETIRKP